MTIATRASDINWKAELRRLEREYDGLPPEPEPARLRAQRALEARQQERAELLGERIVTWGRILLVSVLAAALPLWPYGRTCGWSVYAFVGAAVMLAVGGLWAATRAWRARLAIAHVVALLLLGGGLALVTAEVLPRMGYGTLRWVQSSTWSCPGPADATVGN